MGRLRSMLLVFAVVAFFVTGCVSVRGGRCGQSSAATDGPPDMIRGRVTLDDLQIGFEIRVESGRCVGEIATFRRIEHLTSPPLLKSELSIAVILTRGVVIGPSEDTWKGILNEAGLGLSCSGSADFEFEECFRFREVEALRIRYRDAEETVKITRACR